MSTNLSNYDIYVYKGNSFILDFKYTDKLNRGIDLSNYEAKLQIRRSRYHDELVAELTENYPTGCFGRGLSGDFLSGQGVTGYTGGLILNYEAVPGNIHIHIDSETAFAIPLGKNSYDLQLIETTTRIQRTILRGTFELLPNTLSAERKFAGINGGEIGVVQ
jgi:hypothetical protein